MSTINVAAFTPPEPIYPPYISVNLVANAENGWVEVHVRSRINDDGSCGSTSMIRMTGEEFELFLADLVVNLKKLAYGDQ